MRSLMVSTSLVIPPSWWASFAMSSVWRRSTVVSSTMWSTSLVMRRSSEIPLRCMPRPKTMYNRTTYSQRSDRHKGPRRNLETSTVFISFLLHLTDLTNCNFLFLFALFLWWCTGLRHLAPSLRCWLSNSHLHWHDWSGSLWRDILGR